MVDRLEIRPQVTTVVVHDRPALFTNGWVPRWRLIPVSSPRSGAIIQIVDWIGGNGSRPEIGFVSASGETVADISMADVIPLSSSAVGVIGLGPEPNEFGDSTTADQDAAEVLRDAQASADQTWLTDYNSNLSFWIRLIWNGGAVEQRRSADGTGWEDVTNVIRGPRGVDGLVAEQVDARIAAAVPEKASATDVADGVAETATTLPAQIADQAGVDDAKYLTLARVAQTFGRVVKAATDAVRGVVLMARNQDVDATETDTSRALDVSKGKRLIERLVPTATLSRIPSASPPANKVWKTDASASPDWRDDTGGLDAVQVDERIAAGVADWAEQGSAALVPDAKIPASIARDTELPNVSAFLSQSQVDDRVSAGVANWAEQGNGDEIPDAKIPASIARDAELPDSSAIFDILTDAGDAQFALRLSHPDWTTEWVGVATERLLPVQASVLLRLSDDATSGWTFTGVAPAVAGADGNAYRVYRTQRQLAAAEVPAVAGVAASVTIGGLVVTRDGTGTAGNGVSFELLQDQATNIISAGSVGGTNRIRFGPDVTLGYLVAQLNGSGTSVFGGDWTFSVAAGSNDADDAIPGGPTPTSGGVDAVVGSPAIDAAPITWTLDETLRRLTLDIDDADTLAQIRAALPGSLSTHFSITATGTVDETTDTFAVPVGDAGLQLSGGDDGQTIRVASDAGARRIDARYNVAADTMADLRTSAIASGITAVYRGTTSSAATPEAATFARAVGPVTVGGATATAGVADWAEQGNADEIPDGKIPSTIARDTELPNVSAFLSQSQVDDRVSAGVANWAEQGNGDEIPDAKIPSTIARDTELPNVSAFLSQSQVDGRVSAGVLDWAEQGNGDEIPDGKIPGTIARVAPSTAAVAVPTLQAGPTTGVGDNPRVLFTLSEAIGAGQQLIFVIYPTNGEGSATRGVGYLNTDDLVRHTSTRYSSAPDNNDSEDAVAVLIAKGGFSNDNFGHNTVIVWRHTDDDKLWIRTGRSSNNDESTLRIYKRTLGDTSDGGSATVSDDALDVATPANESTTQAPSRQTTAEGLAGRAAADLGNLDASLTDVEQDTILHRLGVFERAVDSIPKVGTVPTAFDSEVVYLHHDQSIGSGPANRVVTVAEDTEGRIGWSSGNPIAAFGSHPASTPMGGVRAVWGDGEAVFNAQTGAYVSGNYRIKYVMLSSTHLSAAFDRVVIGAVDYEFTLFYSFGYPVLQLSGQGAPLAAATFQFNLKKSADSSVYYNDGSTRVNQAGLWQWDEVGTNYRRLVGEPPSMVLWGAAQSTRIASVADGNRFEQPNGQEDRLYLKWKIDASELWFGAVASMATIVTETQATAASWIADPDIEPGTGNRGEVFLQFHPGVWVFEGFCALGGSGAGTGDYFKVKLIRVRSGSSPNDEILAISQGGPFTADEFDELGEHSYYYGQRWVTPPTRLLASDVLMAVVGPDVSVAKDTMQYMTCRYYGDA